MSADIRRELDRLLMEIKGIKKLLYSMAKKIYESIIEGKHRLIIPFAVIVEVASVVSLLTGLLGHIALDIMACGMKPQSYSPVYRMMNGFGMGRLCSWKK